MANKKNNELNQNQNTLFLIDDKGKMIVNPNIQNNSNDETDKVDYFEMPMHWDNDSKKNVYTEKNLNVDDNNTSQNLIKERYERIKESLKRNSKLKVPLHITNDDKDDNVIYDYIKTVYEKAMRGDSESEKYKEILNVILNGTPETADKDYIGIDVNELPAFLRPEVYKKQLDKQNEVSKQDLLKVIEYLNEIKYQMTKEIKQTVTEEITKDLYQEIYNKMYRDIKNSLKEELQQSNIDLKQTIKDYYTSSHQKVMNDNEATTRLFNEKYIVSDLFAGAGATHSTKVDGFIQYDDPQLDSDIKEYINDLEVETTLGEYLKTHGISQTWLAEQTGISRNTIINIIKNPNSISYLNAKKISLALGESIHILFPVDI